MTACEESRSPCPGPQCPQSDILISTVVPVLNAMRYLPQTIPPLLEAAASSPGVEIIYVDNGSTDGSYEFLKSVANTCIRVYRNERGSSGATRNLGASQARGSFLSFLDADCLIANDYFPQALAALRFTGAAATGCETKAPPNPHWIEATWENLHYVGRARDVDYIASANFFILREAFERIGGFREDLNTGEDAEICQRLTTGGYRIYESPAAGAIHLGNPKSIREFYRRSVWHGLGMFGTVNRRHIDKPTAMTSLHAVATLVGLVIILRGPFGWLARGLIGLGLQLSVPSITVAYRVRQTGRRTAIVRGILLYWMYYWSRLEALLLIVGGRRHSYTK